MASARLANQQIGQAACGTAAEVVARFGAMQAQDYPGALWAIGLRLPQATEADIEKAIAARTIVRTWPMRGTLHFVAATDVRWMLELLTPRILAGCTRRHQQLELNGAIFARSEKVFTKALRGGKQLGREAMYEVLRQAGISSEGQRGYHILWFLAQQGVLCFGERQGRQPSFALLDEWLPKTPRLSREASLATLACRYFGSHGPATLQDFVWWSGLTVADAKAGIALASAQLTSTQTADTTYWGAADAPPAAPASRTAHLLPAFDEFLLGYRDRSAVLDPRHADRVVPGGNGVFLPIAVIQSRVVGIWKRVIRKNVATVMMRSFVSVGRSNQRALQSAAQHYAGFLRASGASVSFE